MIFRYRIFGALNLGPVWAKPYRYVANSSSNHEGRQRTIPDALMRLAIDPVEDVSEVSLGYI